AVFQVLLAFRVASLAYRDPPGQALHDREVVDLLDGGTSRGEAGEIRSDRGLALTVVAVDAGRTLVEPDVGNHRERHAALLAVRAERHPQLLKRPQVAAR